MSYIQEMQKSSTTLYTNARVLHNTYDRGLYSFKSIFVYLCWWPYMKVIFTHTQFLTCICIIESVCTICSWFYNTQSKTTKTKTCVLEVFMVCCECTWFLAFNERGILWPDIGPKCSNLVCNWFGGLLEQVEMGLGWTNMFMVNTLDHIINEETNTKDIEDIIVDAHYIQTHRV